MAVSTATAAGFRQGEHTSLAKASSGLDFWSLRNVQKAKIGGVIALIAGIAFVLLLSVIPVAHIACGLAAAFAALNFSQIAVSAATAGLKRFCTYLASCAISGLFQKFLG